jgi:hypothetical protein
VSQTKGWRMVEGRVGKVGVAAVWRGHTPFRKVEHSTTEGTD